VHGPTRAIALKRLEVSLEQTQVAGMVTNLAFLGALTRHKGFAAGDVDTGLIGRNIDALVEPVAVTPQITAQAAMAALDLLGDMPKETGFSLWAPLMRSVSLVSGEDVIEVAVQSIGADKAFVHVDGMSVEALRVGGSWSFDGDAAAPFVRHGDTVTMFVGGGVSFGVFDPLARDASGGAAGNVIEAPMPGAVRAVLVEVGDTVVEGQKLAVLEAMKMEHGLLAARDGVVAAVLVAEGDQVEAGTALVQLEEDEA